MKRARLIFLAVLVLATTRVFAAPTTAPADQNLIRTGPAVGVANDSINTMSTSRIAWSLAIVLSLILILRVAAKKFLPGVATPRTSTALQVLLRSPIAPRQQLMIVQVGRRLVIVSDSGQQINTLCEITNPEEVAEMLSQINAEQAAAQPKHFRKIFAPRTEAIDDSKLPNPELATTRAELNGLLSKVQTMSRQFRPNS